MMNTAQKKTIAVEALRTNPDITDEELARALGLDRPSAARFWRLAAQDVLDGKPDVFSENFFDDFFDDESAAMPPADYTVQTRQARGARKTTSTMTQEELRQRRTNTIESAKFGRPAHETFMLVLLKFWLIVGPIAFVLLTTSEVAYILTSLVKHGDTSTYVITGGALFIDIAMMFVTFGVAIKRRDAADKREAGTLTSRENAEVWMGTGMWLTFALINIISQGAFLLHIISQSPDANMSVLYVFIAARVAGFILGDASTAFFLAKVDGSHIKLIARGEREKGAVYKDIAIAEGERRLIETKSEAAIEEIQLEIEQKKKEAAFMAELKRQMFESVLTRQNQPLPPPQDGPSKSRMYRSDRS